MNTEGETTVGFLYRLAIWMRYKVWYLYEFDSVSGNHFELISVSSNTKFGTYIDFWKVFIVDKDRKGKSNNV